MGPRMEIRMGIGIRIAKRDRERDGNCERDGN